MKPRMLILLLALAACDKSRGMDTRTFELARLTNDQALALLTPYISEGGYLSGKGNLLTVRERPDRLEMIDDMLKRYDGGGQAMDVVLDVQVIEADGFTQRDSSIADIEQTLRSMFKYRGYRLLGETHVRVREGNNFEQQLGDEMFAISGQVDRVQLTGPERRVPISVQLTTRTGDRLYSTVTGTIGKPLVLGQSRKSGAIILVLRPTLAQ